MIDAVGFIQRLNRTKTLSLKLTNVLMEAFRTNRFEAQETFLSPGNYASSIYYIENGLVRGAIEGSAEKITTWFKQNGSLIIPQGLINQQPSGEYISAVTKTSLIALPFKSLKTIGETIPEVMELLVLLVAETATEAQYREKLLRLPAAKDRYNFLSENEDFILKRIPNYLAASYLNVTKETFSRLHKGLPY
ncbi:Crp/Fnr family transcriptional regulator [Mucilaginibacter ginsenosidivorax]|uniref:Crp/Fnr family transcriptional regulator n=1 Tax=Mucilaginibacter ginsenosidivorax TaxID=862126 RepID=A0A5B8W4R9_9SPHI|nr:cyclic nucleotide-binding domain-containing protein [Mucilaginibacter ginsenosidivorax]QEC78854.1 Crp/Fnr family transcriptional regulator [Mucilaginibacter ginsenosidivorax]